MPGWPRWKEAAPEARAAMAAEGALLAQERRAEFKALIASDPRSALERAVPRVVRQDLPKEIVDSLEQPVSAKGDLNVYMGRPAEGMELRADQLTLRYFETGGTSYKARVFGGMERVTTRQGLPLQGVALDREMAVAENAVRPLEKGERIPAGTVVEETCPVSGKTTEAVSSGEAVTDETPRSRSPAASSRSATARTSPCWKTTSAIGSRPAVPAARASSWTISPAPRRARSATCAASTSASPTRSRSPRRTPRKKPTATCATPRATTWKAPTAR